jgi:hypothetical protein
VNRDLDGVVIIRLLEEGKKRTNKKLRKQRKRESLKRWWRRKVRHTKERLLSDATDFNQ